MRVDKNEAELCEAVIRLLEQEIASARHDVRFPELDRIGPPVECRFGLAGERYAIEHTLIEPFADHIRTGSEFNELVRPIEAELNGTMPTPGTYTLLFPVHSTAGRHRRTHAALRDKIIAWAREAGAALRAEAPSRDDRHRRPHGYSGERTTVIDGLPLRLDRRVHWSESGRHDGALFVSRVIGEDLEAQRLERVRTALDRKLGKLMDCRAEGDKIILVLEFSDIVLTNHILIGEALEIALSGRGDIPDLLLIADTTLPQRWNLFPAVIDGIFSIDMEWIEVDPSGRMAA